MNTVERIATYAGLSGDQRAEANASRFRQEDQDAFAKLFADIDTENARRRNIASFIETIGVEGLSDTELISLYPNVSNSDNWKKLSLNRFAVAFEQEATVRGIQFKDPDPHNYHPSGLRTGYGRYMVSGGHYSPTTIKLRPDSDYDPDWHGINSQGFRQ